MHPRFISWLNIFLTWNGSKFLEFISYFPLVIFRWFYKDSFHWSNMFFDLATALTFSKEYANFISPLKWWNNPETAILQWINSNVWWQIMDISEFVFCMLQKKECSKFIRFSVLAVQFFLLQFFQCYLLLKLS